MRTVLIVLLSIFTVMDTFPQTNTNDRKPYAAGKFYPADRETLKKDLSEMFAGCKKSPAGWKVRAIISPHAGYIFSGKISAAAFSSIPDNSSFKNIFIIGSSHVMYFDGASVYNNGDYVTPLGKITVNKEIANALIQNNKVFNFPADAHVNEHSIENQIPFIQYYFKNIPPIIPVIIGTDNENTVRKIADALMPWFTPENLFIISSDFSHYPSYKDAIEIDHLTASGILTGNPEKFLSILRSNAARKVTGLATSMCGWTSGLALLDMAEGKDLEMKFIDYCNSGDSKVSGKDEVVGYNAIALIDNGKSSAPDQSLAFNDDEKKMLFDIVNNTIRSRLIENREYIVDETSLPGKLKKPFGAFVTIKINGSLRGCVGRFTSSEPLYSVVRESATGSAFEDPRFSPLTKEELKKTNIEITVLGPLMKISNINEIVLGKHGIYIKKGNNSGTMLPQVATEYGWTLEQFLGYTSRDKAGLGWDGWKDAEIFIYEGVVLKH